MFALIDTQTMQVKYKSFDNTALLFIAAVEYSESLSFNIRPISPKSFTDYTVMELQMLYRNITGDTILQYDPAVTVARILEALHKMPESEINRREAGDQAHYVEQNPGEYKYIFGASVPAKVQSSLFE